VLAVAPIVVGSDAPGVGASGTPDLSLSESAPQTVLYGTDASVSLTAGNPSGGDWGYNLSFEDVLPAGVSYVTGTTTPATVGDPQILLNEPATNQTTLTWSNVSDLSPGSSYTLGFQLAAATDTVAGEDPPPPYFLPNDSYTDSSSAYVNSDPRYVPLFAADGTPSNYTGSATAGGTTALSPLAISQSPSGAELRGVHDHQFVSTITVTNNDVHATDGISVTDWLPAGLEYLLCGQSDNTSDAPTNPQTPESPDEYPGSGLISGHTSSPANCLTPASVATEDTDPDGGGELPTAVYTEVQWTGLGNLAPGASLTLRFVTAIPIRANTMTWTNGAPSAPSLLQAANLDNNSGPETVDGTSLTIYATATGNYTGALGESGSNPVAATGYDTILARDIITSKSVSDGAFTQGQVVTYTITVSTSEYRVSDGTTVTDTLPSGLCPLGDVNYDAHSDPQCTPNGDEPSPAYASVTENADGTFTIVWDLGHMDNNATDTITFPAVDRGYYQADDQDTAPTVGNDTLTNTEIAAGNLSVICGNGDADCTDGDTGYISHDTPITVDDVTATASASQSAAGPTLDVYVSQSVPEGATNCTGVTDWLSSSSTETDGYPPTYQKGDLICFQIDVSYPPGTDFKNPVVTDFIPPNSDYEAGTEATTGNNTADNVSFTQPASGELQWAMGDELADPDGNLYESPDTLFEVQFGVIATADPPIGNDFQLTQDLAKLVTSNTEGTTFTDRGLVTYQLAAPIVTLSKAVTSINGSTDGVTPTGDTVRGGDEIGYTLTVTSTGIVDAHDVEVWDPLPAQIQDCASVTSIVPGAGNCVTVGGASVIEWPPDAVPDLGPGDSAQLSFTVQVPTDVGADEAFDNSAGVRSFLGANNQGTDNPYYPENNIDPTVTSGDQNAPEADGSADVTSAGSVVTKSAVVTSTNTYGSASDATVGDTITYTVEVTVPHDTSFYGASLADPLGGQQDYVTGSGQVTLPDATVFDEGSSAEGFTYAYNSGTNTVTLTFPTPYANATSTDQVVTTEFSVTVADVSANEINDQISNVATLSDHTSTGELVTASNSPVKTSIVEPDVAITKTVSAAKIQPGGTNTFTIRVTNPTGTGVSTAWDIAGTDTIPTTPSPGLTYVASSLTVAGPSSGPLATAGEAAGVVSWSIPELEPGQSVTITYQVNPPASDEMTTGESWTNTATLTSWCAVNDCASLPGTRSYGSTDATQALPAEYPTLQVTKTAPNGSTALDDTAFGWKVVVKNTATVAAADAVAVTDTLPEYWSYNAGSTTIAFPSGPDSTADPTASFNGSGDEVLSWTGLGALDAGQSLTITYTATPEVSPLTTSNTGPGYAYPNSAYATADDETGASGNGSVVQYTSNTSTADAYIGDAVLQITKTHSGNFSAGADGTYSLVVTNHGPSAAGAPVTVSDAIVSPETYVSASGSNASYKWGCSYSSSTLTVTCTLETTGGSATTLPSGTTAPTISVVVDTPSSTANGTLVTNIATVSSPTWDSNPSEETSSNPTTIDANAALAITKSHSGSFTAGGQGTYTVSVVNNGPSDAQGTLTVTDTLPSGETLVSATGTDWTCGTPSGGVFTCTDPNALTSGSYAPPITEVVDVTASLAPGSITNSASVGSPTNNPDPSGATSNNPTTIVTSADLALTKVHVGTFVAGDDATYDFTVTNSEGPSDAAGTLTVTDTLPIGETFVSGGGGATGWTCSVSSGTVTCTDPSALDVGDSTSFTMTVAIASGVTVSTLANTATVSSPTSDPVPSNNTSTDDAGTTQSADLQVVKTLTSSLVAGQQATYSLAVSDGGPSDAAGPVTLTDTLPGGESYVSATGTGWSCGVSLGTVTCTHAGSIVAGAAASVVTLTVDLASDVLPTSISNTATVGSPTPDPDVGNNTSTTTNSSSTSADLSIAKTDDGPFTAGDDGEYHIVVSNAGPSDAQATIVVTDTLPSGETYVSASGTEWSCSDSEQVVTCDDYAALTAGQSAPTIDLVVAVASSLQSASVTNDASVSSPTSNPDPGDESTTDTTSIDTSADLAITKTHTGDLTAGSDLTYSLVVTNNGPSDAVLPKVIDDVPSPLVLVSAGGGSAWDCGATTGNDVSCTAVADLPAGATEATISVEVSVPSSQPATGVTNISSVTSTTSDPNESNNSSSDPTSIVTSADLTLTKVHQETFTAGDDGSYLITVDNLGPSDAAGGLTVSDTLPSVETFVSGTGTDWTCSATGQAVSCTNPDTVPDGENASALTLTVAIASSATGDLTNSASVVSTTPAPDPDDNSGSDTTTLTLSSDLSVTKSHVDDFTAGLDGTYTIGVHNAGPSDSGTGVVVTDTLPAGESFVSSTGTGWSCSPNGQSVNCTQAASIPVTGDAPSLQLTVAVGSGAIGTLTNVAQVQGPNPDPNLDNNTASDPTTSQQLFDISLAKTLVGELVEGKDAVYSLAVTNAGPSDSTSPVVVTDPLPDGLTFVSATEGTGNDWSCAAAGQAVTCTDSAAIVATASSTVEITVAVSAGVGIMVTNIATAAATGDVDAASEVGSADGMVEAPPPIPDAGAPKAAPWPFAAALLLVLAGLALAVGSRRWQLRRPGRAG
jgi:uncharacterized repeat protein (TIGR01451 family)/fimbrial isopeptide formation D2 family protein